ncbi:MAG: glycosyl transferase family 4, partial [Candidatus Pacearchaeota archaeon]
GFLWEDMNKWKNPKNVAASGGIIVLLAFLLGVLTYIAFLTFIHNLVNRNTINIFAILLTVLIAGFIGFVDDILGWKTKGLPKKVRLLTLILASVPLIVVNAGIKKMVLPFFGEFYFGIFYPLFLIPLGVVGVTSVYNFLAGFNGLEAGLGVLILSFLGYVSYISGNAWLAVISFCMVFSLFAFLIFNWCPAKVFGGNVLTYSIGSLIAAMAIVGNFEKIAFIVFIPFIIEMFLKIRGRLEKHSFGKPKEDNSLELRYDKIYGLTHFSIWFLSKIKNKVYEKEVVLLIFLIELIFIFIAYLSLIGYLPL